MASSIINFIIKNFLYNFLEINPNQTNISLLSGEFTFKNVKIKQKLLEYINIDYLEIITGYLGSIKILLNLPNFYSNPIKIYITDFFIYSKQKKLDNIKEKERIESLNASKFYKLELEEDLLQQINKIVDQSDNFVNQIIKNINISIKNIVFRFEDDVSNPKTPFSLGLIMKSFKFVSINELYNDSLTKQSLSKKSSKESFVDYNNLYISDNPYEISDKKIIFDNFYFYIDYFNTKEGLNYNKYIDENVKNNISENFESYINEILNFYYFCQSELNSNIKKKNIHKYIFYNIKLDVNLSMNFNVENNNPLYKIIINDIKNIEFFIRIQQISLLFNLLSYYHLYYYYLVGLNKTIFNLSLNVDEKERYILDYLDYYYNKYTLKNIKYSLSKFIKEKENKMTYEDIKYLRKISINNLRLFEKLKEKENKLASLKNTWFFFSKKDEIKKYENELGKIKDLLNEKIVNKLNKQKNTNKNIIKEKYINLDIDDALIHEKDPYEYLPDSYILFLFQIKIDSCHLIFYDDDNSEQINSFFSRKNNKKLIDINLKEFLIKMTSRLKSFNFKLELLDMNAYQEIIDSTEYDAIFMTKTIKNKNKLLSLEFESNQIENYTYKIIIQNGRKIIFVLDLFILNYIQSKILNALYTSISFMDLSQYAEENINKYLKLGYMIDTENKLIESKKNQTEKKEYSNYYCDINIISPIIIMPQNILDKNNIKCIIINLGEISIKSNLVESSVRNYMINSPEYENNNNSETNYIRTKTNLSLESDSEDLYDNYNIMIKSFNILFSDECLKKDNYISKNALFVINNFDISALYQTLIIPSFENLNSSNFILSVDKIFINLDEFQLLLLIDFFKHMTIQNDILYQMNLEQIKLSLKNKKIIEIFKDHLIEKGILNEEKNEEKENDEQNKKLQNYLNEKDFLTKTNQYWYEIKINMIILKIYKIYPDFENNLFLEFHLDYFNYIMCGNSIKDSLMKLNIKSLKLLDKEKDVNRNPLSMKEYQTLIENKDKDNNSDMFSYSMIYVDKLKRSNIEMNINNTNLIVTFDVITRIYIFSMYFFNIFYENYINSTTYKNKIENQKNQLENDDTKARENKSDINSGISDSESNHIIDNYQDLGETIKQKNSFRINLVNIYLLVPYEIYSLDCPIISMKLNMVYDQSSERVILMNIDKDKKNFEAIKRPNNNNMNIMIYDSDFDLIKYDITKNKFKFNKEQEKIISNYRIQFTYNYSYCEENKQTLAKKDISIEPIIVKINLENFKDLLLFYNQLMKFLYENLYEIYIPYVNYYNVVYHNGNKEIKKKKKLTLKRLLWRISIMYKIRKSMKKMKGKLKRDFSIINSRDEININMNKVTLTIFNNELCNRRLLFELQLSKMIYKSIFNSNPRSKINISNELLRIISGKDILLNNYIIHLLYKYMNISFIFKCNYYNLEYSSYEPFIEPVPFEYLCYQVDDIFKYRAFLKSESVVNFNISPSLIKALNTFLNNYYSDSKEKLKIRSREIQLENNNKIIKDDQIVLKIFNKTGLPIKFWFNFKNDETYTLSNGKYMNFSNDDLYGTRRQRIRIQRKHPEKNTFCFQLLGYETIKCINLSKNNTFYLKTKSKDNQDLYYHIEIDNSGFINKIKICSSIIFINKTKFEKLVLSIDDKNIKDNFIILKKDRKCMIPLSWIISKQKIFFQIDSNSEKNFLYNNILDCIFCQKLKDEEFDKLKTEKMKIREDYVSHLNSKKEINFQHPKYKEYISSHLINKFNNTNNQNFVKKTTFIDKNSKNKSLSFSFNYIALSIDENHQKTNNEIFKYLENTEKSYKYYIIIRPILTIYNFHPFNIILTANIQHSNSKKQNLKMNIEPLKSQEIYDINWTIKEKVLITLSLNHYNNIFTSNKFPLMEISDENNITNIQLKDKKTNSIISKMFVKPSEEIIDNLHEIIEQFSFSSIDYIFFSEYIINNRMEFNIYAKKLIMDNEIYTFKNKKLNLLSDYKDIHDLYLCPEKSNIKEENHLILSAIGINKDIELINNNSTFNISCIILNSTNYIYSNIIILESKYFIVNNLDFDIYYTQVKENQNFDEKRKKLIMKKIRKKDKIILSYDKQEEKIRFQLGMKLENKFSLTGPFDIDESKDLDVRININKELYEKYYTAYNSVSYKSGNEYFLYFRLKFEINQYCKYILILFPIYPLFEIKNRTNVSIIIYGGEKSRITFVEPEKDIPFIWEDPTNITNKLYCKIFNKNISFSFANFEIIPFKVHKGNTRYYFNLIIKRNKRGSRVLYIEEKNSNKKHKKIEQDYFNKQSKSLSETIIDLKGFGLSFINETPKEIFYISFYGFKLEISNILVLYSMEFEQKFNIYLQNFQIDYCLNDSLKTFIYPKIQKIPSLEEQNKNNEEYPYFLALEVKRYFFDNVQNKESNMEIRLDIQELKVKINQIILMQLLDLIKEYNSLLDYNQKIGIIDNKEDNLIENNDKYIQKLLKGKVNNEKIIIKYLKLFQIKISITLRIDLSNIEISFLPQFLTNIIITLGNSLIRISESPISFNSIEIYDIYMEPNKIMDSLYEKYKLEAILQIYKILGSTDLIGNPVNLIDKIGTGFFELVNEPTKGLMKGPSQFGKGLVKGVEGFVTGVVGGTMDSVNKISDTLYSTVHGVLGKSKTLLIDENEDNEPKNLLAGAEKGIEGGYNEIKEGVEGLFIKPFERENKSGIISFVKDLGMGVLGLAVSPITVLLKMGGFLAVGTKNTFLNLCNRILKNDRFRFPRYIDDSKPLEIYDENLSAAKEFLMKFANLENPNILFFSSFNCNNPGYKDKLAFIIITKELFLLLSNQNEILWKIAIKDIQKIKLFYKNDNFRILFKIKNKNKRVLIIDKSDAIVSCNLYDILEKEKENFIFENKVKFV